MTRRTHFVLGLFVSALFCVGAVAQSAQQQTVQLDPAKTRIEFTLGDVLHTVHGSFRLKNGSLHFDPATGAVDGALVVDATSGDSGNHSRDKKMNKEVLESAKYPEIVFLPQKFTGHVNPEGASQVTVSGIFRIHGADHPLTLIMPVRINGNEMTASTRFEVPYEKWGMKNPSTFVLRVSNKVSIDLTAVGQVTTTQVAAQNNR
jgi:polyisoprenoid-binding protein YceI